MIKQPVLSSNVDVVRFLAQGINDPDASVKIMHNLERLNKSNHVSNKLKKRYENEVQELQQKIIGSNTNKKTNNNNNNRVTHINNGLDNYSKFRLNGLRTLLKSD